MNSKPLSFSAGRRGNKARVYQNWPGGSFWMVTSANPKPQALDIRDFATAKARAWQEVETVAREVATRVLDPSWTPALPRTRRRRVVSYVIRAVGLGLVKIGRSVNPAARLQSLGQQVPITLELVAITATSEKALHRRFAAYRFRGEWFREEGELAAWVATLQDRKDA